MRAGELRHRIRIEERLDHDQDTTGDVQEQWVLRKKVWGSLDVTSGREFFAAQQVTAARTARARLRYFPSLTDQDRVVWTDPRTGAAVCWNITSLIDVGQRHAEYELMLEEVPSGGPARNP